MAEGSFVKAAETVGEPDIVDAAVAPELEEIVKDAVVVGDHRSWQPTPD